MTPTEVKKKVSVLIRKKYEFDILVQYSSDMYDAILSGFKETSKGLKYQHLCTPDIVKNVFEEDKEKWCSEVKHAMFDEKLIIEKVWKALNSNYRTQEVTADLHGEIYRQVQERNVYLKGAILCAR